MNSTVMHKNILIKKIEAKSATTSNPKANLLLEIIHQVIANLIHKFDLKSSYLDEDEPSSVILEATNFW